MKYVNLTIMAVLIGFIVFIMTRHVLASSELMPCIYIMFAVSVVYGVLFVMPIGGADMPVVISLLNSFTGVAAAMGGFLYNNQAMLTGGILVGRNNTYGADVQGNEQVTS
jgi:NAD(P) transhydrogenase subunit beta